MSVVSLSKYDQCSSAMSCVYLLLFLDYPLNKISFVTTLYKNILPVKFISEPAVLDWDRIVHKNVQSSDRQNSEKIDAESAVIITEHLVQDPKLSNHRFNAQSILKTCFGELEKYRVYYYLLEVYDVTRQ
jgi:hypothetical protein